MKKLESNGTLKLEIQMLFNNISIAKQIGPTLFDYLKLYDNLNK